MKLNTISNQPSRLKKKKYKKHHTIPSSNQSLHPNTPKIPSRYRKERRKKNRNFDTYRFFIPTISIRKNSICLNLYEHRSSRIETRNPNKILAIASSSTRKNRFFFFMSAIFRKCFVTRDTNAVDVLRHIFITFCFTLFSRTT